MSSCNAWLWTPVTGSEKGVLEVRQVLEPSCLLVLTFFFSRMRSEGFSFNFGSLRVELCSPVVVFVFATVRNRSQVFESGSYGPAVGESSKK